MGCAHVRPRALPAFRSRSSSLGISNSASPSTHPRFVHSSAAPQQVAVRHFGRFSPCPQRVPSLPFLTTSTVSSVPWAAGLLHPAADHGVHLVSSSIPPASPVASSKVPLRLCCQPSQHTASERGAVRSARAPVTAWRLPPLAVPVSFRPERSPLKCHDPSKFSPPVQLTPRHPTFRPASPPLGAVPRPVKSPQCHAFSSLDFLSSDSDTLLPFLRRSAALPPRPSVPLDLKVLLHT